MTYRQYARLQLAKAELVEASAGLAQSQVTLDLARRQSAISRFYAAAPADPAEQTVFIDDLRRRAQAAGVNVVSWRAITSPVKPAPPANSDGTTSLTPEEELLKGVDRVSSELTLQGPTARLRSFLGGFPRSDRLYTVSAVTWERAPNDAPGTRLALTVSRYVTAPLAPASAPAEGAATVPSVRS